MDLVAEDITQWGCHGSGSRESAYHGSTCFESHWVELLWIAWIWSLWVLLGQATVDLVDQPAFDLTGSGRRGSQ